MKTTSMHRQPSRVEMSLFINKISGIYGSPPLHCSLRGYGSLQRLAMTTYKARGLHSSISMSKILSYFLHTRAIFEVTAFPKRLPHCRNCERASLESTVNGKATLPPNSSRTQNHSSSLSPMRLSINIWRLSIGRYSVR